MHVCVCADYMQCVCTAYPSDSAQVQNSSVCNKESVCRGRLDLIGLLTVCLVFGEACPWQVCSPTGVIWVVCTGEQENTKLPFLETSAGLPLPHLQPMNLSQGLGRCEGTTVPTRMYFLQRTIQLNPLGLDFPRFWEGQLKKQE